MSLELLILTPDHKTKRVELDSGTLTLGRAHSNDLSYPDDASLSRRHVQFSNDSEDWWVEDLGSKNGTLVNGIRIAAKQPLGAGDRLSVGHLMITLSADNAFPRPKCNLAPLQAWIPFSCANSRVIHTSLPPIFAFILMRVPMADLLEVVPSQVKFIQWFAFPSFL